MSRGEKIEDMDGDFKRRNESCEHLLPLFFSPTLTLLCINFWTPEEELLRCKVHWNKEMLLCLKGKLLHRPKVVKSFSKFIYDH